MSSSMSRKMRDLCVENSRTVKHLDKELLQIETERRNRMRELNQATKHFLERKVHSSSARSRSRECSPDNKLNVGSLSAYTTTQNGSGSRPSSRSPSPNPRSPLDDLFPLSASGSSPRTQKVVYRKSLSTDESPQSSRNHSTDEPTLSPRSLSPRCLSPRSPSPGSSPESQRHLLSKRKSNSAKLQKSHSITDTNITQVTYLSFPGEGMKRSTSQGKIASPRTKRTETQSGNNGIPTIVVSDTTPKLPEIAPTGVNPSVKKNTDDAPKKISSTKSSDDQVDGALRVPIRRSRSNSAPNIGPPSKHLLALAKKESTFTSAEDLNPPEVKLRPRSSSICVPYFAHLKNAPRRESLLRKYIARPKTYHRTSKTIEHLISDLAKGIDHGEFDDYNGRVKPISPEEWESLKLCRYLRMPTKDGDVKGNTLDIDEIFSQTTQGN